MKQILWTLIVVATLIATTGISAQVEKGAAAFANPVAVERAMDSSPAVARGAIEAVCTQEQIDAIQAALVPPPTDEEKIKLLEGVVESLRAAEYPELADVVSLEVERAKPVRETGTVEIGEGGEYFIKLSPSQDFSTLNVAP